MKIMTRHPRHLLLFLSLLNLTLNSCSSDEIFIDEPFVVAFEEMSTHFDKLQAETPIQLVYSESAEENGSITIQVTSTNTIYGEDYTTIPAATNNLITLPVVAGETNKQFLLKKLRSNHDETTEIEFEITAIDAQNSSIQGYSSFLINAQSASMGGSISPEIGGPNEQYQAFVDLSSQNTESVLRDAWDLKFYCGDAFRVSINGSIYMAAKALDQTDIDNVQEDDLSDLKQMVAVGTFDPENANYVDAPSGNIFETAIDEIAPDDLENPVYLLNLGYEVGTGKPNTGSVNIAGDHRGWKKIRILRTDENYLLQYADLDASTHEEIIISKDENYNFKHFSLSSNKTVPVEPPKWKWDLCFTVFTNVLSGAGSYGFSDFVVHNNNAGVKAYQITDDAFSYEQFSWSDVENSLFSKNQTSIGSNWRSVFEKTAFPDRFYVLKDPNENIYKLQFLTLTNIDGERGHPTFKYELLKQI